MSTLIRNPDFEEQLRAERHARGLDRWDEVWEGVYVMPPYPNDEHQEIQAAFVGIFQLCVKWAGLGEVRAGVNVSDRIDDWSKNYRCPDVAVFLNGTTAKNLQTHWLGGSDFAIEIVSPDDSSRDKLDFYASVGVRELLIIDRAPWKLELYRRTGGQLVEVAQSVSTAPDKIVSQVVPFSFRLIAGGARPSIEVTHSDGVQRWVV
jgi:Uma2 family endonuclease